MINTMIDQILETLPNKEVYYDFYVVDKHYKLLILRENNKIIGFTLVDIQENR